MYFQLDSADFDLKGRIFEFLNLNISLTFALSITMLTREIPILTQERNNTSYRLSAFFIAKTIEDVFDATFYGLSMYISVLTC